MLIVSFFGGFFKLDLRVLDGLWNFLTNWDIDVGPFGMSFCWSRCHRLVFDRHYHYWWGGKLIKSGRKRCWALWPDYDKKSSWAFWRYAYPDHYRGEYIWDTSRDEIFSLRPLISFSFDWHGLWLRIKWRAEEVIRRWQSRISILTA